MICLVAGLLLCGANIVVQHLAVARRDALTAIVRARVDALAGYTVTARGPDAMGIVANAVDRKRDALTPFRRAFDPSLADTLVAAVAEADRRKVRIETLALGDQQASLTGWGNSWDASKGLLELLQRAGYAVSLTRGEPQADERIPFTLSTGARP